jgi:hypothetical protein
MSRTALVFIGALIVSLALSGPASAEGEGILAMTGQYTFFIKPEPGSCETYYQKLVPCVLTETIPVPRPVTPKFLVPRASIRGVPVLRHETPVGCAEGAGPCLECFPRPTCKPAIHPTVIPVMNPVAVRDLEFQPKHITRRVMKPQWFKVTDEPRPMGKVRKVPHGG